MPAVAPYPYDHLPKISRAQVASVRQLRRRFPPMDVATALATARRLLGVPCEVTLGAPEPATMERARNCVGLVLDDASDQAATTMLLLPRALGGSLASRLLGGEGEPVHATATLDPWATGALAYLAARVLAALQGPFTLREVASDPIEQMQARLETTVCLPLRLTIAGTPTWIALFLSDRRHRIQLQPRASAPPPTWLSQLPVALVATAGNGVLTRSDLETLDVDDIFIPENCELKREHDGFAGRVVLQFLNGHRGYFALHSNGIELMYQETRLIEKDPMTDDPRHRADALDNVVSLGSDAPIAITVELARFTLPLGEISALQPGDTFNTRAPIGAHVTLRAGGVAIATGELVDIEGETGVRIVEIS